MKHFLAIFSVGLIFGFLFSDCSKESFFTGEVTLNFSQDTLRFDTVFTQVGSATRSFKIFNPLDESVKISKLYMELGADSKFNINVDGIPGGLVKDVEIGPKDSIYVFAEVTIDPDQPTSVSPFVLDEQLIIETNGHTQKVVLEAWGQNANYIPNNKNAGGVAVLSCDFGSETWDDPRPYVIYGILVIQDCTLNLPKGARLYVHGGVALSPDTVVYSDGIIYVGEKGGLMIEGTEGEPVIIQGDRLEPEFEDVPGQWAGIRYATGSLTAKIEHAKILNSIVGVRVDSAANLTLNKVEIRNSSSSGLVGVGARIKATNCLFADNGGYGLQFEYGGVYNISYCTVANYGNEASALKLSNTICLNSDCTEFIDNHLFARIDNCILFGSQKDEIELFDWNGSANFDYKIRNSIVRVKDLTKANAYPDFFDHCNPCINGVSSDKLFADVNEQDYQLDSLSIAEKKAIPMTGITDDLLGVMRDATNPDIGCYEYQP